MPEEYESFDLQLSPEEIEKKNIKREIYMLKKQLERTDYKAIKYAEGLISELDYIEIRTAREKLRKRIRDLRVKLDK